MLVEVSPDPNESPHTVDDSAKKPLRPVEEETLVSGAQSGDADAFCALIDPYLRQIYLTAARITRSHADAEDASQECLVKAFLHIRAFRNESKFSTWLMRIAINESLMLVRKRKIELRYILGEKDLSEISPVTQIRDRKTSSNPEAIWMQKERKELIKEAVSRVGADLRLTMQMLGAGEMRRSEISRALQVSPSAVNTRLRRGFRKLRRILTERLGGREELIRGWI